MNSHSETRMAKLEGIMEEIRARLNHVETRISDLETRMNNRISDLDKRIGNLFAGVLIGFITLFGTIVGIWIHITSLLLR